MVNVFKNSVSAYYGVNVPEDCIEISEEDYEKLKRRELIWENDQIVPNPNWEQIVAERETKRVEREKMAKIAKLKRQLAQYDYIGVKIAMGVATREDYANEIAETERLRAEIRELEK